MNCVAHQALRSMGFPRQEYCSGLPFPFPGDLPEQIKPGSLPLQEDFFCYLSYQGSPWSGCYIVSNTFIAGTEMIQFFGFWSVNRVNYIDENNI